MTATEAPMPTKPIEPPPTVSVEVKVSEAVMVTAFALSGTSVAQSPKRAVTVSVTWVTEMAPSTAPRPIPPAISVVPSVVVDRAWRVKLPLTSSVVRSSETAEAADATSASTVSSVDRT